jgi:hypothetical protein
MPRTKKYEDETNNMIHKVEQAIVNWMKSGGHDYPSIHVNPEFYYADDGRPSRYLTLHFGHGSEIRISVERQLNKKLPPWTCYSAVFMKGQLKQENQFNAGGFHQIIPELTKNIIGRYEYAFDPL